MAKQKQVKAEWHKASEILPSGNVVEGIVCLAMPSPKCVIYGNYADKNGKTVCGFHDLLDNGKIKEYSVQLWSHFPFPESK